MESKKIISVLVMLIALGVATYFIVEWNRASFNPVGNETAGWKTYSNDQYGFEIKHPSEWTPWEGFTVMYDSSVLPAVLRVCFGPEVQNRNYCGVELYVIREDQFPKINSNTFLGFPRRLVEELEFKPWFGNKPGTGIETYDPQRPKRIIRNGFLKHDGFVYLLVAYNSEEFQKLQRMTASFTFLTQSPDISNWKTYRNEKYGFEMRYPSSLEPIEGKTLFYSPEYNSQFSLCFASTQRREFYCEVEFYVITTEEMKVGFQNGKFLGKYRCPVEIPPKPIPFTNLQGNTVEVCEGGLKINSYVEKNGLVYLFTVEPSVGYIPEKSGLFESVVGSFRFIKL